MFSAKQFRVIVHLDHFFKDHRREARIFINKSTKTIADLEKHISELFNINNFFLLCQNCFLPSAEDVRILQEDETVWVWSKPALSTERSKTPKSSLLFASTSSSSSSSVCSDVIVENKNKKLKTKSENSTYNKDEMQINHESDKAEIINNDNDDDEDDDDDDDDSSTEETDDETQNQRETFQAKNTQTPKEMESTKKLNGNNASNNTTRCRDGSIGRSSSVRSFKIMSSIGALMDSLRTSGVQSDDSFVNKSRRKRVRKRKRSSKEINGYSSMDIAHETIPISIPIDTIKSEINCSGVHLRFNDDESANAMNSFEVKQVPVEQKEQEVPLYNYSVLNDEDFLKYPIMQNTLPRAGDIISFKVLKISENYNPEVSKYIVAKVVEYNVISSMVTLKILYGTKELVNPQGKFYIEIEDKDTADIKEMQWSRLITPRLLFP